MSFTTTLMPHNSDLLLKTPSVSVAVDFHESGCYWSVPPDTSDRLLTDKDTILEARSCFARLTEHNLYDGTPLHRQTQRAQTLRKRSPESRLLPRVVIPRGVFYAINCPTQADRG